MPPTAGGAIRVAAAVGVGWGAARYRARGFGSGSWALHALRRCTHATPPPPRPQSGWQSARPAGGCARRRPPGRWARTCRARPARRAADRGETGVEAWCTGQPGQQRAHACGGNTDVHRCSGNGVGTAVAEAAEAANAAATHQRVPLAALAAVRAGGVDANLVAACGGGGAACFVRWSSSSPQAAADARGEGEEQQPRRQRGGRPTINVQHALINVGALAAVALPACTGRRGHSVPRWLQQAEV